MKIITLAFVYFLLSTIITWWFIKQGEFLYFSQQKMLLSCSIAGAKWGLQILAALILLQQKKWVFTQRIGLTCLIGSFILLPYCLLEQIRLLPNSFLLSLIIAVVAMIFMYYKSVLQTEISIKWFWSWICCLVMAICLQLLIVF